MRDILNEALGSNPDPVKVAARSQREDLPKRFYKQAQAVETDGGYELHLDGRPARTPGRAPVAAPSKRIGEAIAAEWNAQSERIDPVSMPVTRTLNSAIDGVAPRMDDVRADIAAYAGSDLLCYRADEPDRLVERQSEAWNPVLKRFAEHGAPFALATGIMPIEQPASALDHVRGMLADEADPLQLAAMHIATTLTGSALLALAVRHAWLSPDDAWDAAHVDEDWNIELWGEDEEASARRAQRRRDYDAATFILLD